MRSTWLVLLAAAWTSDAAAQSLPPHASVPLDHWSTPFLEYLIQRNVVQDPSPLERPWQAGEIRRALLMADTARMTGPERHIRRRILAALLPPTDGTTVVAAGETVVLASTHARRPKFSLRPEGPDRITPQFSGYLAFQFGPILLLMQPRFDENIDQDPEFAGPDQPLNGRFDRAYGSLRTRYVDIDVGSLSRNWGPPGFPGLLVSDWPLSYDQVFVRLGTERVQLEMLVTQLDDAPNRNDELSKRYFVAHRLTARLASWMTLAAWQGTTYGGPNRSLELWVLNPFRTAFQGRDERGARANAMIGGDGQLRFGELKITGSLMADDFSGIFDEAGEPASLALTATAAGPVGPAAVWFGYTLVTNLAYRTNDPVEYPLIAINPSRGRPGTGMARNFSDYDQVTLRVTTVPLPGVLLTPELTLLRQGEGDIRLPFPNRSEFANTPTIHSGVVERTWRAALLASIALPYGVQLDANAGVHRLTNVNHVAGQSDTEFVGSVALKLGLGGAWPFD